MTTMPPLPAMTPVAYVNRRLAELGFQYVANAWSKTYKADIGFVTVALHVQGSRLTETHVTVQYKIKSATQVPEVSAPDMVEVLRAFQDAKSLDERAQSARACDVCKRVVAHYYVVNDLVICTECSG